MFAPERPHCGLAAARPERARRRLPSRCLGLLSFGLLLGLLLCSCKPRLRLPKDLAFPSDTVPGVSYTNYRDPTIPLSAHVVRIDRSRDDLRLYAAHARTNVLGVTTLSNLMESLDPALGEPVAAINGDFFERTKPWAGDPRGVQIVEGELTSAPTAYVSFWVDPRGQLQATNVASLLSVRWPDGHTNRLGLNEARSTNGVVLYTPRLGSRTETTNGFELVLEPAGSGAWLPLRPGQTYEARVRRIRSGGHTPIPSNGLVLSVGPLLITNVVRLQTGAVLRLSTATRPDLSGVRTALGGGPMLVRGGKVQRIRTPTLEEAPTKWAKRVAFERHPRTALGWNKQYVFLVEVDGRQLKLSEGLTLAELARFMARLGCEEAVNLDGGGSATFWFDGRTRNSPCDKRERDLANALIALRRPAALGSTQATNRAGLEAQ